MFQTVCSCSAPLYMMLFVCCKQNDPSWLVWRGGVMFYVLSYMLWNVYDNITLDKVNKYILGLKLTICRSVC